ncbi:MAG: Hsp70 family protein, partial [archaeon]|nr:Hsp70 family protein [archaeon]
LNATAKDMGTGKEQKITITASKKLSQEEIKRMVDESEKFAEQDKKRREEAELRNFSDTLIYTADKTKADLKEKLSQDQIERIDKAINELKDALSGKDVEKIKAKNEQLSQVLQEIGAMIYQQAAQQAQKQEQGTEQKKEEKKDKVIDADYEVVDDKK